MLLQILSLTFFIFALLYDNSEAATYWVSKEGTDSNPCFASSAEPNLKTQTRLTIKAGAACLASGDTLMVMPGSYNEHLTNILPSGATLRGANPDPANWPSVKPQNNVVPHQVDAIAHTQNRTKITYKYFRVDLSLITSGNRPHGCWGSGNANLDPLIIEDFECIGAAPGMMSDTSAGINTSSYGGYAIVRRGTIRNMISGMDNPTGNNPGAHGLYWHGSNGLAEHVLIQNVNGRCINLRSSNGIQNNIFRYNICKDAAKGDVLTNASNTLFHNNVYWNANRVEIKNSANSFVNNTVFGTGLNCIRLEGNNHVVQNNIFLNCGSTPPILNESTGSIVSHNLTSGNPATIFQDHTKGNFALRDGSPAINAGTSVSGILCNSICDQGAHEYRSAPIVSVPPSPTNLQATAQ